MQPESGVKTWQWVVTAIIIVILIVIGVVVLNKGDSTDTPVTPVDGTSTSTSTSTSTPSSVSANRFISLTDQFPGNVVNVSSVQLSAPAWVVIHKDEAGKKGAVIGSTLAPQGTGPVSVKLISPMVDGGMYYAVLHADNGDKRFDATKDAQIKDAVGNFIMRTFKASSGASTIDIKG